jgi:putative ABC transport system ATP-binding protein
MASQMRRTGPDTGAPGAEAASHAAAVSKFYGAAETSVHALQEVTFTAAPGEFVAIMGPSGSGKSSLLNLLAGVDVPSAGRVWLGGREITGLSDRALTAVRRRSAGFVFQSFNLVEGLSVAQNVLLPYTLDNRRPDDAERSRIDALIDALGLRDRIAHRPHELSGGQQQRVAIARALATSPAVVFADEPTGNLDSRTGRDVLELLRVSADRHGRAVVMVTHDPVAAASADRVVLLVDGRIERVLPRSAPARIADVMLSLEARP